MNTKKFFCYFSLLFVFIWMGILFFLSSQTGNDSSKTSGTIVDFVMSIIYPSLEEYTEEEQLALIENVTFIVRKGAHFTAFGFLGFLFYVQMNSVVYLSELYGDFSFFSIPIHVIHKGRFSISKYVPFIAFFLGVLYACSDEFHQMFVDSRGPSLRDVLIDSCGVFFGVIFGMLLFYLLKGRFHYGIYASKKVNN